MSRVKTVSRSMLGSSANASPKLCRTIVAFHGNAGNIGARIPIIDIFVKRLNSNFFIVDYRGYGNSEGTPSEEGLKLDAEATFDYLMNREDVNKERIYLMGSSLGGAVAVQLAMKQGENVAGVILENTFTSIGDMVDQLMPMVATFKSLIQRIFYPTIDRIPKVTSPILFIRGMKDEIVPKDHSQRLFEASKSARFKQMYECPEGNHNETWRIGGEEYIAALRAFFIKCEANKNNDQ